MEQSIRDSVHAHRQAIDAACRNAEALVGRDLRPGECKDRGHAAIGIDLVCHLEVGLHIRAAEVHERRHDQRFPLAQARPERPA